MEIDILKRGKFFFHAVERSIIKRPDGIAIHLRSPFRHSRKCVKQPNAARFIRCGALIARFDEKPRCGPTINATFPNLARMSGAHLRQAKKKVRCFDKHSALLIVPKLQKSGIAPPWLEERSIVISLRVYIAVPERHRRNRNPKSLHHTDGETQRPFAHI